MDTTTASQDKSKDKDIARKSTLSSLFYMYIRRGNRKPETKYFELDGTHRDAILRAQQYCDRTGFRFCGCFPMLSNLDREEQAISEGNPIDSILE